ncbi:TRAP transporter substrate-binding protein DctP [Salipiger abyssi]|uniref:TRAP-type C4-dicarboxylate transport system, periplasmic component n=1 Tax=Salipiger abyssi TaxID=1250539 RepID=A0A1P8V0U6_9RHOB|nr:TRAP transporter substrate-binding protein DctP [Salipiger abyssi]APZ55273.1 TRAP-type C4-dicarboxylate transport system, periplasmic component [Salipiger abyssi]
MEISFKHALAASAVAALSAAGPVSAKDLTYAIGFPTGSTPVTTLEKVVSYAQETHGLNIKLYPLSLLDLRQTPQGISDHIVDMGWATYQYQPAEFANSNLAAAMNMMATANTPADVASYAMAGAVTEYISLHCPECTAEFAGQNQVYFGGHSTGVYLTQCTKPVVTKADFAGIKVRTAAPSWARWAENVGATSVTISANEAYDALSQGVVDCVFFAPTELVNFQLTDVVTDMTTGVPGGVFPGVGDINTNLDTWRGMTVEERAALIDTASHLVAEGTYAYVQASEDAMDVAREIGIGIHEAAPDLLEASAAFVEGDQATIVEEFVDKYGLDDAGEKAEVIGGLIAKWKELTADVESGEALQAIYWDEIYSKLDPETYALQ